MLAGALAGVVVGGFLIDGSPWLLFAAAACCSRHWRSSR